MFGFASLFGSDFSTTPECRINPASGLPMLDGAEVDIAGNIFGMDSPSCAVDSPFDFADSITSGFGFDD